MRVVLMVMFWLLQAVANPQDTAHLQLKTSASADAVAPGGKVTLQVDVTPKAKMRKKMRTPRGSISRMSS